MRRSALLPALVLSLGLAPFVAAATWPTGARVIVEKAGAGHRAIILKSEPTRAYVAYEGADEAYDEWVDLDRVRSARPLPAPAPDQPPPAPGPEGTPAPGDPTLFPVPEPLPHALELPRAPGGAAVAEAWLEQLPRASDSEPVRFNTAMLALPRFAFGGFAGLPTARPPLQAALLHAHGRVAGFAAVEDGVMLYVRDPERGFEPAGRLPTPEFDTFSPEVLLAADFNGDGLTDLLVAGGPLVQVYFGAPDLRFVPAAAPYRGPQPVRGAAAGRFFTGPLAHGVAVIEGFNTFRLFRVAQSGVTPVGDPYAVRFDRITRLVAGDFDGDGFSDLAVSTEHRGRSTGAWMFFNQRGANKPFLWPVGGRDDFARDLFVADLDKDGRDDLVFTDSDVEQGERIRVVFGAAGRAGWEDPWELIGSEYGLGLGTAAIVVADFNRDGRPDLGIAGRNGLRIHLGADYRRFSRNPVWPRLAGDGDFPEQRSFLAGDFDGDGTDDLLGYTPAFATGYNILFNATAAAPEGVHVPVPLRRRAPAQASTTVTTVDAARGDRPAGVPEVRYLASRAEPYGQWRYRLVVEVAVLSAHVVESLTATCRFEGADQQPAQEAPATVRRMSDQQWSVEVVLPRGRAYEFRIAARDDQGNASEPIRVTVNP